MHLLPETYTAVSVLSFIIPEPGQNTSLQIMKKVLSSLHLRPMCYTILSLTIDGRKNRCIPCIYWAAAIFAVVADYSNLFLSLTFFLNRSHFTFGYELIVRPETTGFMKIIRDLFPLV